MNKGAVLHICLDPQHIFAHFSENLKVRVGAGVGVRNHAVSHLRVKEFVPNVPLVLLLSQVIEHFGEQVRKPKMGESQNRAERSIKSQGDTPSLLYSMTLGQGPA